MHNFWFIISQECRAEKLFGPRSREQFEISAYDPTYELIDIHDDRAYTLVSFTQVLRPYDGGPGMKVHGRAVQFWRLEDGQWRLVMLLTARSAPEEQVP